MGVKRAIQLLSLTIKPAVFYLNCAASHASIPEVAFGYSAYD